MTHTPTTPSDNNTRLSVPCGLATVSPPAPTPQTHTHRLDAEPALHPSSMPQPTPTPTHPATQTPHHTHLIEQPFVPVDHNYCDSLIPRPTHKPQQYQHSWYTALPNKQQVYVPPWPESSTRKDPSQTSPALTVSCQVTAVVTRNASGYMMYQYTPDEQPLVPVDHIQQQPLICVWQFVFVCVLVLQVKFGLVKAQTKAGNLQKKGEGGRQQHSTS